MEATSTAPTSEAPAPAAAEAPSKIAPIREGRLFRTAASDDADTALFHRPEETGEQRADRERNDRGQFVAAPDRGGDPNAGVIAEARAEGEGQDRDVIPAEVPTPAPPPSFTPITVGGRTFSSQRDLEAALQPQAAAIPPEFMQRMEQLEERLALAEPQQQEEPGKKAPENPFAASIVDIDNNQDASAFWTKVSEDLSDERKGPLVALARVSEHFEKRIAALVEYINHGMQEQTAPMQSFLTSMQEMQTTASTFAQLAAVKGDDGALRYPEVKSRAAVTRLTQIMQKHNLALTPENFDLAYQVFKAGLKPEERPRPEAPPRSNAAAAAAASVLAGRGTPVNPRDEPRPRSFVDSLSDTRHKAGMFRV